MQTALETKYSRSSHSSFGIDILDKNIQVLLSPSESEIDLQYELQCQDDIQSPSSTGLIIDSNSAVGEKKKISFSKGSVGYATELLRDSVDSEIFYENLKQEQEKEKESRPPTPTPSEISSFQGRESTSTDIQSEPLTRSYKSTSTLQSIDEEEPTTVELKDEEKPTTVQSKEEEKPTEDALSKERSEPVRKKKRDKKTRQKKRKESKKTEDQIRKPSSKDDEPHLDLAHTKRNDEAFVTAVITILEMHTDADQDTIQKIGDITYNEFISNESVIHIIKSHLSLASVRSANVTKVLSNHISLTIDPSKTSTSKFTIPSTTSFSTDVSSGTGKLSLGSVEEKDEETLNEDVSQPLRQSYVSARSQRSKSSTSQQRTESSTRTQETEYSTYTQETESSTRTKTTESKSKLCSREEDWFDGRSSASATVDGREGQDEYKTAGGFYIPYKTLEAVRSVIEALGIEPVSLRRFAKPVDDFNKALNKLYKQEKKRAKEIPEKKMEVEEKILPQKLPKLPGRKRDGELGKASLKKKKRKLPRIGQKIFHGWDMDSRLGPHNMDHIPTDADLTRSMLKSMTDKEDRYLKPFLEERKSYSTQKDHAMAAKDYVNEWGIHELFNYMITNLLVDMPNKPLDYLIDMTRAINRSMMIPATFPECFETTVSLDHVGDTTAGLETPIIHENKVEDRYYEPGDSAKAHRGNGRQSSSIN